MVRPLTRLAGAIAAATGAVLFAAATALAEPNTVVTTPLVPAGNGSSADLRFDRNGRFATFASTAENLVPGQVSGGRRNVFLYDRIAGTVRMVSHRPGEPSIGGDGSANANIAPQISADGNWVVFTSAATDLIAGQDDDNASLDVFLWSRESDISVLVSRRAGTTATAGNGESSTQGRLVTVSDDGRYVVFGSSANDLILGQTTNAFGQVYQFDRETGSAVLISHASSGFLVSGNNRSDLSTLLEGSATSSDGRFAVFQSLATNHKSGISDGNGNFDIYLWDRDATLASSLVLLSRSAANPLATGNAGSTHAAISANGKFAVFTSVASDLEGVTSDTNSRIDLFRYDRLGNLVELVSHRSAGATTTGNGASQAPMISAGGDQVTFQSGATNLVLLQNDDNAADDIFLWRGSQILLVSHAPGSNFQTANGASIQPLIGPDGGIGFASKATDLVTGIADTNDDFDAFYRPRTGAAVFLVSHLPDGTATGDGRSTVTQLLFGGGLVAFLSTARDLVEAPINGGTNLFHHGSLIMADGFESGDFAAWSQHLP